MFESSRAQNGSSLYITMKKYRQKIASAPVAKKSKGKANKKLIKEKPQKSEIKFTDDNKCIIKAKISNKKISTIVSSKDLERFQSVSGSLWFGSLWTVLTAFYSSHHSPSPIQTINNQQSYSSLLRGNLYGLKDKKKVAKKSEASRPKQTAN